MVASTSEDFQPLPARHWKLRGMGVGIGVACVGVLLFAIILILATANFSSGNVASFFQGIPVSLFFILLFGIPPAILLGEPGGILLVQSLKRDAITVRLRVGRAIWKGAISGGIAGFCACLLGVFVVETLNFVGGFEDFTNGYFTSHLSEISQYVLTLIVLFRLPILLATAIACLMGAWAGRILTRQLLNA